MKKIEKFKLITGMSWRNVWRNKRRSFLTFLTIMVGCAFVILMRSLQNGGFEQLIDDYISPLTGHIQVNEKGFWKYRTLEYAFKNDSALFNKIRSIESVSGVAPRICAGGLLICGDSTAGSDIVAIDPELEKSVITMHRYILQGGRFLKTGDMHSIVIGNSLASNLGVKTGGTVSLVSQGFDGSIASDNFSVVGIFRCPNPSYNRTLALIPFAQGMDTFSMSGYISSYVLRVDDIDTVPSVTSALEEMTGQGLEIIKWDTLIPEIIQMISLKKASSLFFVSFLYMIVAFGILNTIQMAVFERIRELGIMLSIGTSRSEIFSIVMIESFFITAIGIAAGMALAGAAGWYLTIHPVDYSSYRAEIELYGVSTVLFYAKMKVSDFLFTSVMIMVLSMIFTFFPARRASKLSPVMAIRHL